jgi:membrane fusion protein, copper/silver efflux system
VKKAMSTVPLLLLIAAAFVAGSWYSPRGPVEPASHEPRERQHDVDASHPKWRSDTAAIAHDSAIVPASVNAQRVPADQRERSGSTSTALVSVDQKKQQLMGLRVSRVEKVSGTHTLRLFGRVAADETRISKLNAAVEGVIQETSGVTTGSHVEKDQWLATIFAPEFLPTIQAYLFSVKTLDRFKEAGTESRGDVNQAVANIRTAGAKLRYLGMAAAQIEEIGRTRELTQSIEIRAPGSGFVLVRNVALGQKFEKGAEWFRIADLNRVWVLADVFENDARYVRPGMRVQVSLPSHTESVPATVSEILPQFDAVTRTLKVRLEADNPGYMLRPDMFVDVSLLITLPPTIAIPADAVLDSGLKKTAFVDRGQGFFEPRPVETRRRFGDQVEIIRGLTPGERVVVSGTFFLDSESRMKSAAGSLASSSYTVAADHGDQDRAHTHAGQH